MAARSPTSSAIRGWASSASSSSTRPGSPPRPVPGASRSFDKLRQVEASGGRADFGRSLKPGNTADPDSFKVRKGKVGGFAEELSEPDILYCNEIMQRQGYAEALSACRRLCYPAPAADTVANDAPSAARHG